jgi:hypothetical protein
MKPIGASNTGMVLANEEIAAIPSMATNVPSTLVIFIPAQRQKAEIKVPIANLTASAEIN